MIDRIEKATQSADQGKHNKYFITLFQIDNITQL